MNGVLTSEPACKQACLIGQSLPYQALSIALADLKTLLTMSVNPVARHVELLASESKVTMGLVPSPRKQFLPYSPIIIPGRFPLNHTLQTSANEFCCDDGCLMVIESCPYLKFLLFDSKQARPVRM